MAFLCLGGGGSRAWILTISITDGHRAGALMLGAISLGCHVTGTFLIVSARKRFPGAGGESALALALVLQSVLLVPLFAIGLIEFWPQQEIVWITLVILDVVQSVCWLFYLHDLAQTAGFPRLRSAFRFARLFAAGRLFTFVSGNLAIVGIGSDIACGLLTAILMAVLARRLGAIARDSRRRGVPDRGLPKSEPATTIR